MRIRRFDNATSFLESASGWLSRREAEHNLLIGVALELEKDDRRYERPVYLATVEDGAEIVGCAFRTPPWKLGLTRFPSPATPLLVDDVAKVYGALPAVLGPERQATQFAELWTQRFGGAWSIGMRQRIHSLEQAVDLHVELDGSLRLAQDSDIEWLNDWLEGFLRDTGVGGSSAGLASRLVRDRSLYLWDDGEPRSMAAALGQTPRGVRVGYVYTPPDLRGRGLATAVVAGLSRLLLKRGRAFCCLYTDLANPTSNAIYRRIGYRPVCDVLDVQIRQPGGDA